MWFWKQTQTQQTRPVETGWRRHSVGPDQNHLLWNYSRDISIYGNSLGTILFTSQMCPGRGGGPVSPLELSMMGALVFVPRPGLVDVSPGGVFSLESGSASSHPERIQLQ